MTNLINDLRRHLSDDVIIQLSKQLGAQDANKVKAASQIISELLVNAMSKDAANKERGGGLFGAIKKDHDGGILGDLMGVLSGQKQVNNPKTMNGAGIVSHLLGNRQLEAAQVIGQQTGLDIFKTGVLMQLIAPIAMGVVGQETKSSGLDLGGLANILLGGKKQQAQGGQRNSGGSFIEKLLDQDGDGSMMDDLLSMGMKILQK